MTASSGNAAVNVEKISAITLTVRDMGASVRFYKDVLGLKMLYGPSPVPVPESSSEVQ